MGKEIQIYKYVTSSTAEIILRSGTLLFSSPRKFNDPFDISVQTLAGYDLLKDRTQIFGPMIELVLGDELPPGNGSELYNKIAYLHTRMKQLSKDEKERIRCQQPPDVWDIDNLSISYNSLLEEIKAAYDTIGVFCASQTPYNLLLWAHYAKDHTGAVLKFKPNLYKDSILRLATEVIYSDDRPMLYSSSGDFLNKSIFWNTMDILKDFQKRITLTKSKEWQYEEEVRITSPKPTGVIDDEKIKFHDEELENIHLGCKMPEDAALNIIKLARAKNPAVEIFKMMLDPYRYKLNPIKINVS